LKAQPFWPALPARETGIWTAHDALEMVVPHVLAAVETLSDAYWNAIDQQNAHQRQIANGLTGLAHGAASRLEIEFPLAIKEWQAATRTEQPASAAPAPSGAPGGDVTLVFNLPDGTECARFDLPRPVFASLEKEARKAHCSITEFITRAIKHLVNKHNHTRIGREAA
jgi:hypothetical protein